MQLDILESRRPFWEALEAHGTTTALIDVRSGRRMSYLALAMLADTMGRPPAPGCAGLTILAARNDVGGVAALLGLLRARRPVLVMDAERAGSALSELIETYRPAAVIVPTDLDCGMGPNSASFSETMGYRVFGCPEAAAIHPDLCMMILTSGSTGSPRAVRLSWRNLATSAAQIQNGLGLKADDRAPLHLPMHYVYGLSVLCSHLRAGGALLVGMPSLLDRQFWEAAGEHGATSLSGVSFTFDMLRDLGARWQAPPSLRRLMHSGDRLTQATLDWAMGLGGSALDFYRMYGMSEACSRMAILPSEDLRRHGQSVGRAVAMGRFSLIEGGEIVYEGPNVMMGYAQGADDLGRGSELNNVLRTGDLGYLDSEGRLYIQGRISRIAKIMGVRVSLDDIEAILERHVAVLAQASDTSLTILHESVDRALFSKAVAELARKLRVPPKSIHVEQVDTLARNAAGKLLRPQPGTSVPKRD
jgi:acyl-CoA synthetase (AMP-forming)/AMP-acid ligase II